VQKLQAEALFQKVMRLIAKQSGEKAAKDAEPQIRQQLAQMQRQAVKNSFAKFTALPPDQKAVACTNFAAEVHSGRWDIQKRDPALFLFLETESL
jgi:predicted negative regulator of RcsB-dependent stress response